MRDDDENGIILRALLIHLCTQDFSRIAVNTQGLELLRE